MNGRLKAGDLPVDIGGMFSLAYGMFFGVMLLATTLWVMRRRVRMGKKKGTF